MWKLKHKVIVHVLLVSLPCVSAISIFSLITARHHVHEMIEFEYKGSLSRAKEYIEGNFERVGQDVRFLANIPPVRGIFRARANGGYDVVDQMSLKQWTTQLEDTFGAAAARGRYCRLSLVDSSGIELIKLEGDGGIFRMAPQEELRDVSREPFLQEVAQPGASGIYISSVSPHGENMAGTSPHQPLIRYAAPVLDADGARRGSLVADVSADDIVNVKQFFAIFEMKDAGKVFVVDPAGNYLHQCRGLPMGSHEENRNDAISNLQKDYPGVAAEILTHDEGAVPVGDRRVFHSSLKLTDQFSLFIGLDIPVRVIEGPVQKFKVFLFCVVIATLGLTWIFSAIFAARILRSIHAVHAAVGRIAEGDFEVKVETQSNDEIQELAAGFNSMVQSLREKTERLTGLYRLATDKAKDSTEIADRIVSFIVSATGSQMATVERVNGNERSLVSFCRGGMICRGEMFPLEGTACAEISRLAVPCRYRRASEEFPGDSFLQAHSVRQYAGVPILSGSGQVLGALAMMDCRENGAPEDGLGLLCTLSRIIGFEWERESYIDRLKGASLDTIHRLSRAAEYRDEDTGLHIERMSRYSAAIARKMGLSRKTVEAILYAAPMHDVGKIAIPDRVLLKPGKLDPDEREMMEQHTVFGGRILAGSSVGFIRLAEVIALTHHEKWDGSGYPKGLQGTNIPLAGRIAAVADVFDALTSERPYKAAFPLEKALAIIKEGRGSHFDPAVVDAFFAVLEEILSIRRTYQDGGLSAATFSNVEYLSIEKLTPLP